MANFPIYSQSAQTGDAGVRLVERIITDDFGWVFKEQENQHKDFGVDAYIELVDESRHVSGRILGVQIKSGDSFFRRKNDEGYIFVGRTSHLNYYLNQPFPIIIILCNIKEQKCWWCEVSPLETERSGDDGWQITVPFSQTLTLRTKKDLKQIAGPKVDHSEFLETYWTSEELLKLTDYILVIGSRRDIEKSDLDGVLKTFERLKSNKRVTRKFQERVNFVIHGYDDDQRELWQIPEVRRWIRDLNTLFPYWFYFLARNTTSLKLIAYCLCEPKVISSQVIEIDGVCMGRFMEEGFVKLNEICDFSGISLEVNEAITQGVFDYFNKDTLGPIG